jgi:hypothetical protein
LRRNCDPNSYTNPNSYGNGNADGNSNGYSDGNANSYTNVNSASYTHTNSNWDSDRAASAGSRAQRDASRLPAASTLGYRSWVNRE